MGKQTKAQDLRDLLKLAMQLRTSASAIENREYVGLFLRAATAIEERAKRLAFGSGEATPPEAEQALHAHVDIRC
jgi:hypothetical protein